MLISKHSSLGLIIVRSGQPNKTESHFPRLNLVKRLSFSGLKQKIQTMVLQSLKKLIILQPEFLVSTFCAKPENCPVQASLNQLKELK